MAAESYEVIVADDGARIRAAELLEVSHPWARVIEGPRRGPAANRNAGAAAARGEWIAFTDDDTQPSAGWLAAYVAALAPATDVYEGRTTCEGGFRSPLNHAPVNETGGWLWSCNFLVSARAFASIAGFDEEFRFPHAEDQDLRVRLMAAGFKMVFVRDAVVDHPPRRQPPGARLGAYREAEVRFMYKHGAPRPVRHALLRKVVRYRLGVIRDTPKSLDSIRALASMVSELRYIRRHIGRWEEQNAALFPATRGEQ